MCGLTLFTLGPNGTICSVPCVGLSDVFMHSRVPHCTTFGAICGIIGLFVGCEVPIGTPFGVYGVWYYHTIRFHLWGRQVHLTGVD